VTNCPRGASIRAKRLCIKLKTTTQDIELGPIAHGTLSPCHIRLRRHLADLDWFRSAIHDVIARFDLAPIDANELETFRALSGREIMARVKVPKWRLPGCRRHAAAQTGVRRHDIIV
jgi:hypothetical protein